jgi:acyl-CoA thioester hydrolase
MTIDFKKPARIDDVLAIETRVGKIGGAIIRLAQTIRRDETVLVTAEVSVVLVNTAGKPQRIPPDLWERIVQPSPR